MIQRYPRFYRTPLSASRFYGYTSGKPLDTWTLCRKHADNPDNQRPTPFGHPGFTWTPPTTGEHVLTRAEERTS